MRKLIVLIIPILALYGCGLAQMMTEEGRAERAAYQQAQRERWEQAKQEEEQQRLDNNSATCRGYGFTKGTTSFANCLMQIDRDKAAAARNNALLLMIEDNQNRNEKAASDARCNWDNNYRLYSARCPR